MKGMKRILTMALALFVAMAVVTGLAVETSAVGAIYLRVYDSCTNTYQGIPIQVTGNGINVTVYNTYNLKDYGLQEGKTYTFSASYDGYETPTQTITMPSGSGSSADVRYVIYKQYDLTVTVVDSLGNKINNKTVTVQHPGGTQTATTDNNGVCTFSKIRGLYTATASVTYDKASGGTGTVSGSATLREKQSITLTIPRETQITVNLTNSSGLPVTDGTVTATNSKNESITLQNTGDGRYVGAVKRTASGSDTFTIQARAKGYQDVSTTVSSSGGAAISKTVSMDFAPLKIVDGNGNAVANPATLYTGTTYTWKVADTSLPSGAEGIMMDPAWQLNTHFTITKTGTAAWNIVPKLPTSSAVTMSIGYKIGSGESKTQNISINVAKGSASYPAAPTLKNGDTDQTSETFQLPADIKSASKLIITATGAVNKSLTVDNPTAGAEVTMDFGQSVRGNVTYSYAYTSDTFNYTGSLPGNVTKAYYQTISQPIIETDVYAYTGNAIEPAVSVASGEYTVEYGYQLMGSFQQSGGNIEPTKLSPYVVKVAGDESKFYKGTYYLKYTVVPRYLTVTAEDQTLPYGADPENKVRAGENQLLENHTLTAAVEMNTSHTGLTVVRGSVKVYFNGTDVTRYYLIGSYEPGKLTTTKTTPVIEIDQYIQNYTYGDTIKLPSFDKGEISVTGAYPEDVKFKWTDSDDKVVSEPKAAGTYTLTAYTEDNSNTAYAEDTVTITISKKQLTVTGLTASKVYDGTGDTDSLKNLTVTFQGMQYTDVFTEGKDYTMTNLVISPKNETYDAGTGYVLTADIALKDSALSRNYDLADLTAYEGSVEITARPIGDVTIAELVNVTYNRQAYTPDIEATYLELPALVKDTDYTLAYKDNTNAGVATITVTGKGNYTDTREVTFAIDQAELEQDWLRSDYNEETPYVYNSSKQVPTLTVNGGGVYGTLSNAADYEVSFTGARSGVVADPTDADTYTVTITGKGNYKGTLTASFRIDPFAVTITPNANQSKTYSAEEPALTYTLDKTLPGGETLTDPLKRSSGENAGTYPISLAEASGNPNYRITLAEGTYTFAITPLELTDANTAITNTDLLHTGQEQDLTPGMVVTLLSGGKTETLDANDYTITGNKATAIGSYTMTVEGKGNFSGTLTVKRKIVPDQQTLDAVLNGEITADNVSLTQKEELEALKEALDSVTDDTVASDEEKQDWEDAAEKLPAILEKAEELDEALNTKEYEAAQKITPNTVTTDDEKTLEEAKKDIQSYLYANSDNITDEEKADLEEDLKNIEDCLAELEKADPTITEVQEWLKKNAGKFDADELTLREEWKTMNDKIEALPANTKRIAKDALDEDMEDAHTKLYTYTIAPTGGSKWIRGSGKDLGFKANGHIDLFVGVCIDGKAELLDSKHYELTAGSTMITLKNSYLLSLGNGYHTIQTVYSDGSTNVYTFQISPPTTNANTGDQIMTAVTVMALSAAAIVVLVILKKRKK